MPKAQGLSCCYTGLTTTLEFIMRTSRSVQLLLSAAASATLLLGIAAPAQASPAASSAASSYVTKTYKQVISAKTMLSQANGSDRFTSKYGGCKIVSKQLYCYAKPWVSQNVGYTPIRITPLPFIPAKVIKAAAPGTLKMKATLNVTKLSGKISWDYGADYTSHKQGFIKRKGAAMLGATSLANTPVYYGKSVPWFDITPVRGTKTTIKNIVVTYTYKVLAN